MSTVLTQREKGVLERFQKHGVSQLLVDPVSFTGDNGMAFSIKSPVVYKVGDSNTLLVFGNIQKSMGLKEIHEWLMANKGSGKVSDEEPQVEKEIDGEGSHVCEKGCAHQVEPAQEETNSKLVEADVQFLMEQTNVLREDAVEALKNSNYDVVSALVLLAKKE